jgi:excisionase family DNA binding protein
MSLLVTAVVVLPIVSARDRQGESYPQPRFESAPGRIIIGMNESESSAALGRFLTLADTAEILNVSASQAYALVRSGELPAIKIGAHGHWRVERAVLESYIEAMYEEARRLSLWNQSDYASLPELSIGWSAPATKG